MWDNNRKVRVVIVDDHPLVIEGFKNVIQGNERLELCGQFSTTKTLLDFADLNETDLVLLDITLPDGNGIEICKELKKSYPNVIIMAISNLSERSIIKQMLQNGASGYLLKTADAQDILNCIQNALQGKVALSSEVKANFNIAELKNTEEIPELTNREKQILKLLAEGKKSAEIAEELFISPLTVKTHRATLLHKFETGNIVVAINKAREIGILTK
ncbi:response regulator [Pedobacter sp.]|uniref:response regulator n=1 Tax=Pedobacter sp. TaxID=1411316 RepID=UPI00396CB364